MSKVNADVKFKQNADSEQLTLTVLGCGTLGKAILRGILSLKARPIEGESAPELTAAASSAPQKLPTRFIACVTRESSVQSVKETLEHLTPNLTVLQNDNAAGCRAADVVILGCKPQMAQAILSAEGIVEALEGKLLISILAGVTVQQLEQIIKGSQPVRVSGQSPFSNMQPFTLPRVVRAMPNTASSISESMTVIATPTPPLPANLHALTTWIFSQIGRVTFLPPHLMDASTSLCGSGPAFFSLLLEAMIDGAVAMGLPRKEAQIMAAQTMKGTAGLVLGGQHPALLRDAVTTPGGCTIGGLLVMEEGRVRGTVARAVREATVVAEQLGKGVSGVNGTRFQGL